MLTTSGERVSPIALARLVAIRADQSGETVPVIPAPGALGSVPCTRSPRHSEALFDDFVGQGEQLVRNGDAQRLGSVEIDDELVSGPRLDRQVRRLLAF
jgi:hypothetical protein